MAMLQHVWLDTPGKFAEQCLWRFCFYRVQQRQRAGQFAHPHLQIQQKCVDPPQPVEHVSASGALCSCSLLDLQMEKGQQGSGQHSLPIDLAWTSTSLQVCSQMLRPSSSGCQEVKTISPCCSARLERLKIWLGSPSRPLV